jgi:predicted DNA-binding ribbon-helix-helix protein
MINDKKYVVQRVQTGVRMERRVLKVLKGFAEYHDLTLGDLLEGIVLHAFDGKTPFNSESLVRIRELKKFYGLDLDSRASHQLVERVRAIPRAQRENKTGSKSGSEKRK